jgi:hypothetical protein
VIAGRARAPVHATIRPMVYVGAIIGLLAVFAWLSAALHAALLLVHRRDEHSLLGLALNGYRFFLQDTWKPSGHALHGRFVKSAMMFFGLVLLGVVVSAIAAATAR